MLASKTKAKDRSTILKQIEDMKTYEDEATILIKKTKDYDNLCLTCNKLAMDQLGLNNFGKCFQLLKNAEKMLIQEDKQISQSKRNKLLSLTLNNLACYYKKIEKPNVALQYLKHSLNIEMADDNQDDLNLAGTHLNLCSIYSSLDKHVDAIRHARESIIIMESYLDRKAKDKIKKEEHKKTILLKYQKDALIDNDNDDEDVRQEKPKSAIEEQNVYLTQAIAYYNLGASYEHMKDLGQAIKSFKVAYHVARDRLGEGHPLTGTINENLHSLEMKHQAQESNHIVREHQRKEKATSNLYKNGTMSMMYKKIIPTLKPSQLNAHEKTPMEGIYKGKGKNSFPNRVRVRHNLNRTLLNSVNNSLSEISPMVPSYQQRRGPTNNRGYQQIFKNPKDDIYFDSKLVLAQSDIDNSQGTHFQSLKTKESLFHKRLQSFDSSQRDADYGTNGNISIALESAHQHHQKQKLSITLKKPNTAAVLGSGTRLVQTIANSRIIRKEQFKLDEDQNQDLEQKVFNPSGVFVKMNINRKRIKHQRYQSSVFNVNRDQSPLDGDTNLNEETSLLKLQQRLKTLEKSLDN